jgi:hypothetical protein
VRQLWHIRIDGTTNDFDSWRLEEILAQVRRLANDATLELVRRDDGSVVLVLNGTEEGYKKIATLFERGGLSGLIGVKVLAFVARFVRAWIETDWSRTPR